MQEEQRIVKECGKEEEQGDRETREEMEVKVKENGN